MQHCRHTRPIGHTLDGTEHGTHSPRIALKQHDLMSDSVWCPHWQHELGWPSSLPSLCVKQCVTAWRGHDDGHTAASKVKAMGSERQMLGVGGAGYLDGNVAEHGERCHGLRVWSTCSACEEGGNV